MTIGEQEIIVEDMYALTAGVFRGEEIVTAFGISCDKKHTPPIGVAYMKCKGK